MGYQSVIVISEFDIMREALVKKARYFSDRPIHLMLIRRLFRGKGDLQKKKDFVKRKKINRSTYKEMLVVVIYVSYRSTCMFLYTQVKIIFIVLSMLKYL